MRKRAWLKETQPVRDYRMEVASAFPRIWGHPPNASAIVCEAGFAVLAPADAIQIPKALKAGPLRFGSSQSPHAKARPVAV